MRADTAVRNQTEDAKDYLREVYNMANYLHRLPEELGKEELKKYLIYLTHERHLSEGTIRFYVAALKFLYRTTLKRERAVEKIRYPRGTADRRP